MKHSLMMSLAAAVPSLNEMILSVELEKRKERENLSSLDPAFEFAMESLVKEEWEGIISALRRDKDRYVIRTFWDTDLTDKMVEYIEENFVLSGYIDMTIANYNDLDWLTRHDLESMDEAEKESRLPELLKERTKELYSSRVRSLVRSYLDAHDVPRTERFTHISQATDKTIQSLNTKQDFHSWYALKIADIVSMKGMKLVSASPWKRKPGTKHVAIREPACIQFS